MANDSKVIDITNAVKTSRFFSRLGQLLGMSHEGKRDLYDIYGYDTSLAGDDGFCRMYQYSQRQGIANRVSWGLPRTCWRDGFQLLADAGDESSEVLADELALLNKRGLAKALERADILNRIGRYSLLLVGVPDGKKLSDPLEKATGKNRPAYLEATYFKPLAYDSVTVKERETDESSPRFDLPTLYQIAPASARFGANGKDISRGRTYVVHWSRVVHLSENSLDSEVEGLGALEPIFNRILDLDKTVGGSAEAYFRNVRRVTGYEVDKDFAATLLTDQTMKDNFDESVEKFTNEWQDHTIAAGAKIKTLTAPHSSPADTVKAILWEISGYTGIPIRVLTGEGAGQLAGSEDQLAMNQIIADRQRAFCAPEVMAVLEILNFAGLIELDPSTVVHFPRQEATTTKDQAEIDNKRADTVSKIAMAKGSPGGDELDLRTTLDSVGLSTIKLDADIEDPDVED